jgi:hypothetical protein
MTPEQLRYFVVSTLGCQCPPEVLENISSETELSGGPLYTALASLEPELPPAVDRIISTGGRLLVLVTRCHDREKLSSLLGAGVRLRDELGFNRIRLAIWSESGAVPEQPAELPDDRCHVHFLAASASPSSR